MNFSHLPPYRISGAEGKPLGSERKTLEALSIVSASLTFNSQEADALVYQQIGGDEPEWMQEVTLWDNAGNRIFTGHIESVEPELSGAMTVGYSVTAAGPWWWLEKVTITDAIVDDSGNTQEAPCFVTPQQDLATSIRSLLDRLQTIGVPLRCGDIDPTFIVPRMVFTDETGADALRMMLGWVPDAMTRINYADGIPKLDIFRRGTADITTLNLTADSDRTGAPISLRARKDMQPEAVEVQSMSLDAEGKIIYSTQVAGSTQVSPIRKQIVSLSGAGKTGKTEPTIRRYLLKTDVMGYTALARHHSGISALRAETGQDVYSNLVGSNVTIWVPVNNGWQQNVVYPRTSYTSADGETAVTPAGYVVMGEDLPDWWEATGIKAQRVKARHRWTWSVANGYSKIASIAALSNYQVADSGGVYFFADLEMDVWTVDYNAGNTTGVVIVHPDDAALIQPHGGLATELWNAQNWIPYEGSIPQLAESQALAMPGTAINIAGARPEWETMKALVSGLSIDLRNGSGTITVGSPPRQQASALIDRFARATSGRVMRI